MTEKEAISRIKDHMEIHRLKEPRAIYITVAFSMAIIALKEIQQYREIGTVEECREAVEKQKAKRSVDYDEDFGYFVCPSCGATIIADKFSDHKFCLCCGQALLWGEREEK